MARRERRKFSDEYKAEVVALVRSSGKSVGAISRDLDLTETTVREWVKRADVDGGRRNGLTTAEREELSRLRRQVRVLEVCDHEETQCGPLTKCLEHLKAQQ